MFILKLTRWTFFKIQQAPISDLWNAPSCSQWSPRDPLLMFSLVVFEMVSRLIKILSHTIQINGSFEMCRPILTRFGDDILPCCFHANDIQKRLCIGVQLCSIGEPCLLYWGWPPAVISGPDGLDSRIIRSTISFDFRSTKWGSNQFKCQGKFICIVMNTSWSMTSRWWS